MQSVIDLNRKGRARRARRADPAPSRWSYRFQRLMLTPGFRLALRAGVPFCLAMGLTSAYLADETRRAEILQKIEDTRAAVQSRPEFMVTMMAVDGASDEIAELVRQAAPTTFPISSFDLDIESIREKVVELDPVEDVLVRIRPGGVLQIEVTERTPAILWRTSEGLDVLDRQGHVIGPAFTRGEWPELPLIAGDGAESAVPEALALLEATGPLRDRVRGLVRVGERRWDLVLDREQRVLLPESAPVPALERVIMLAQAQDILARDLAAVDMRLADRPTLRMNPAAVQELWRIRQLSAGGLSQ